MNPWDCECVLDTGLSDDTGISVAVHNNLGYGFAVAGFPRGSKTNLVAAVLELEAHVASKVSGWKGGRK